MVANKALHSSIRPCLPPYVRNVKKCLLLWVHVITFSKQACGLSRLNFLMYRRRTDHFKGNNGNIISCHANQYS